MRRIGIGLLACFSLLFGCEKQEAFHLKEQVLEIELNSEVDESKILDLIDCHTICEEIEIDTSLVMSNKVGEYPVKISWRGVSEMMSVQVVDRIPPTIEVSEFTLLLNQNVIWNRELFESLNVKVSDNVTPLNELYKNISISEINTNELGWQEVLFTVVDGNGNSASCETWVEIVEKEEELKQETMEEEEEEIAESEPKKIELPQLSFDEEGNPQLYYQLTSTQMMEFLTQEKAVFILMVSQNNCSTCRLFEESLNEYFEQHIPVLIYQINLTYENLILNIQNNLRRYIPFDFYQLIEELNLPFIGTPAMYLIQDKECIDTLVGDESEEKINQFMNKAYELMGIEDVDTKN